MSEGFFQRNGVHPAPALLSRQTVGRISACVVDTIDMGTYPGVGGTVNRLNMGDISLTSPAPGKPCPVGVRIR